MELSEPLWSRSCEPNLQWIPREKNQLADDLTNEKFDSFPMHFRNVLLVGIRSGVFLKR